MILSYKRIQAIFMKDWKDLMRNSYVLVTLALPLVFAIMYDRMGAGEVGALFAINFAFVIAGAFIQSAMVAEEKEKNTLRGLLLSPASIIEVFIGKSLLSAFATIFIIVGCILLSNYEIPSLGLFILLSLINIITFIGIGTMLGLVSKTVMETSIIGMPILIVFGMASTIKAMMENETILNIIEYLPSEQFSSALIELSKGAELGDITKNIAVLGVWAIVAVVATIITYKKRRFD
ncbi:ABC transporter permease [Priestia endophytica]|uniref:ABC transporter permease n=1 Tax=Priestia endophytica TaxID=135735 RepID=UPI0022812E37|nr:ABC transporter permease [Priestia endophytica]MCY8231500.1 ABC transporter permease [Priestia endophytica]